eukprot:598203-Prymnesium_polylepis.1
MEVCRHPALRAVRWNGLAALRSLTRRRPRSPLSVSTLCARLADGSSSACAPQLRGRSRSPRTTLVSSFEDKVDLLRSQLPQRSSDTLRKMLRAQDGDVDAVLRLLS